MNHNLSLVGYILMIIAYFLAIAHYLGYAWSILITCLSITIVKIYVRKHAKTEASTSNISQSVGNGVKGNNISFSDIKQNINPPANSDGSK